MICENTYFFSGCGYNEPEDTSLVANHSIVRDDGSNYEVVDSFEVCEEQCTESSECDGFTYHTNLGRCWLQAGVTGFDYESTLSYRLSSYLVCSNF